MKDDDDILDEEVEFSLDTEESESESVEESGREEESSDYDEIRKLLEGLKQMDSKTVDEAVKAVQEKVPAVATAPEEIDVRKILDEDTLDELDSTTIRALNKAIKAAVDKAVTKALEAVPSAIGNVVDQRARQQIYVYKFYKRNPQLVGREAEVQRVAAVLWEKNPELQGNLDKFFGALEKHMRRVYPVEEEHSPGKGPKSPTTGIGMGKEKKGVSPVDAFFSGEI